MARSINYEQDVINKPKINGIEISGNKDGSLYFLLNNKLVNLTDNQVQLQPKDGYIYVIHDGVSSVSIQSSYIKQNTTIEIMIPNYKNGLVLPTNIYYYGNGCAAGVFTPTVGHNYAIGVGIFNGNLSASVCDLDLYVN